MLIASLSFSDGLPSISVLVFSSISDLISMYDMRISNQIRFATHKWRRYLVGCYARMMLPRWLLISTSTPYFFSSALASCSSSSAFPQCGPSLQWEYRRISVRIRVIQQQWYNIHLRCQGQDRRMLTETGFGFFQKLVAKRLGRRTVVVVWSSYGRGSTYRQQYRYM